MSPLLRRHYYHTQLPTIHIQASELLRRRQTIATNQMPTSAKASRQKYSHRQHTHGHACLLSLLYSLITLSFPSLADIYFYDQHICHVPVEYTFECWNCSHSTCDNCLLGEQVRVSLTRRSGSVDSQASDSDGRHASESDGGRSNRSDWEVGLGREELEGMLSRLDTVRRRER